MEQQKLDALRFGEIQPERDPAFIGEFNTGKCQRRRWRATRQVGVMSLVMKVAAEKENQVLLSFGVWVAVEGYLIY